MFNSLSQLLSGKQKERRHSPRKKVKFNIAWVKNGNELVPGIGMEISLNGCLWATKTPPGVPDFDIIMEIGNRKIRTRLHTARSGTILPSSEARRVRLALDVSKVAGSAVPATPPRKIGSVVVS